MVHTKDGHAEPAEAPPGHDEDPTRRLTENAAAILGIAFGVFSGVGWAGLALLPASTLSEKALICGGSLALAVATVAGIGAWRSIRRFTVTATSMGLAIVFLAVLSAAAGSVSATQSEIQPSLSIRSSPPQASLQPSIATPSGAAPAPTSSASPGQTTPSKPASQSLIQMTMVDAASSSYSNGPQKVNARQYQQTLYDTTQDDYSCNGSDTTVGIATYELDYKYHHFHAVVGLADTSTSGDTVTFSLLVDQQPKGPSPTLGVGQTESIDVDVTGAFRITLQDSCTGNNSGNSVTAVWINPAVTG